MREPSLLQKALLALGLLITIAMLASSIGGAQDVGRAHTPTPRPSIANAESSAEAARPISPFPPTATPVASAELAAVSHAEVAQPVEHSIPNRADARSTRARRAGRAATSSVGWSSRAARPHLSPRMVAADSAPAADETESSVLSLRSSAAGATVLTLARACFGEEGFSIAGCAAVVYALRRQAHGGDVAAQARRYCSSLKGTSPRQLFVQQLPAGDEPSWNAATNRLWAAVRATAAAALAGRIANPCPRALHFGALDLENDVKNASAAVHAGVWVPVRCHGDVGQAYYALARATVPAALASGARP